MRDVLRGSVLGAGVPQGWKIDPFEQAFARTKQDWCDHQVHFVNETRTQVLLNCVGSASEADISPVRGLASSIKCNVNAFSNEVEGSIAFHCQGRACVIGEYVDWDVIGRILAPPAFPIGVGPVAAHWPEHVPAKNPGAYVLETAGGEVIVDTRFSAIGAKQSLLKRAGCEGPRMKGRAANTQRVVRALISAGTEPVD